MKINSTTELNDGNRIPYLGLGVYQAAQGQETVNAVVWALDAGYRHIDTAQFYGNEKSVGEGIRISDIPREQIFVTTKIANSNQGFEKTIKTYKNSLEEFGFPYFDLLLVHWPVPELRKSTWEALEQIKAEGLVKSIGVSNYTIKHLKELLDYSNTVPVVNQVEFSPFLFQKDLLEFCEENGIKLVAYSPLTQGNLLDNSSLRSIAQKYNKTTAQVLLRWGLEHQVVVIPKSTNKHRIKENADIFDFQLDQDDMDLLDGLDQNKRFSWDPTDLL